MISAKCLSQLKNFESQCIALEKENATLREAHKNLNKNMKLVMPLTLLTVNMSKLKKAHDNDLQVISNPRESLALETNARKDVETKASSLHAKFQEKEVLLRLKALDASRIEGLFSTYPAALKQFGAEPYALPKELTT